jgi:two-component sensor histidine kinase
MLARLRQGYGEASFRAASAGEGQFEAGSDQLIDLQLDWPPSFEFTTPIRGAFGWFIGEVLTNAVRHGAPGTTMQVSIACDRVRKELAFSVSNTTVTGAGVTAGETYGGLAILRAMARLLEWRDLKFDTGGDGGNRDNRFVASWRVPVAERRPGDD